MIGQAYYTSCRSGLASMPGFQFNAASPDLDRGVLAEIERVVGYEPPSDAPLRPTAAELAALPVAFAFTRLRAGGSVIARTRYLGTDYSGRQGNFFAHVLYLRDAVETLAGVCPIELWKSPVWTETEAGTRMLVALPGPPIANAPAPEELMSFLAHPARQERLALFLAAVRANLEGERVRPILLVERRAEDVARWIAVASYSLPPTLAQRLTFTTYTRRPYYADQAIVGTTPGADFSYTAHELDQQYVVLDFIGGRFSPSMDEEWARIVARLWRAGSVKRLEDFRAMAGARGIPPDPGAQAGLVATFALAREPRLSDRTLRLALEWACAHPAAPVRWSAVGQGVERNAATMSLDLLGRFAVAWQRDRAADEAEKIVTAYLDRVLAHAAAGGSCAGLTVLAGPGAAQPYRAERLAAVLEDPRTPLRAACELLELLAASGYAPEERTLVAYGAERVRRDALHDPDSQAAVALLLRSAAAPPVADGLLRGLDDELQQGPRGFDVLLALADGPLGPWLAKAGPTYSRGLQLVVTMQEVRSRRRREARASLLTALVRHLGGHVRWAYRLLYAEDALTASDALELARTIPTAVEELADEFADVVLNGQGLDDEAVALARTLAALEPRRPLLQAVAEAGALRASHRLTFSALERAALIAATAADVDSALAATLRTEVMAWAIRLAPDDHAQALERLLATRSKPILLEYKRLALIAPQDRDVWVADTADLFCAWVALESLDSEVAEALLDSVLSRRLRDVPRKHLEALDDEIARRGFEARLAWRTWRPGRAKPRR